MDTQSKEGRLIVLVPVEICAHSHAEAACTKVVQLGACEISAHSESYINGDCVRLIHEIIEDPTVETNFPQVIPMLRDILASKNATAIANLFKIANNLPNEISSAAHQGFNDLLEILNMLN